MVGTMPRQTSQAFPAEMESGHVMPRIQSVYESVSKSETIFAAFNQTKYLIGSNLKKICRY